MIAYIRIHMHLGKHIYSHCDGTRNTHTRACAHIISYMEIVKAMKKYKRVQTLGSKQKKRQTGCGSAGGQKKNGSSEISVGMVGFMSVIALCELDVWNFPERLLD